MTLKQLWIVYSIFWFVLVAHIMQISCSFVGHNLQIPIRVTRTSVIRLEKPKPKSKQKSGFGKWKAWNRWNNIHKTSKMQCYTFLLASRWNLNFRICIQPKQHKYIDITNEMCEAVRKKHKPTTFRWGRGTRDSRKITQKTTMQWRTKYRVTTLMIIIIGREKKNNVREKYVNKWIV